jgi:2-hydroxychromene-2-carboxylate isomerase
MNKLDIYFDYVSPFPYLLNEYILKNKTEEKYSLDIEWIPIFLGGLWPQTNHTPPNASDERKMRYTAIEAKRYADDLGVNYQMNLFKPIPVLRATLAAKKQNLFKYFHTALYRQIQGLGQTPDEALFAKTIMELGGNAERLLQDMGSAEIKNELLANAQKALANDVFGVPFVIYDKQPYWGYNHFPYLLKELEKKHLEPSNN